MTLGISVVLATYNRAASLQKTLETFTHLLIPSDLTWELIVVDNNSRDQTRAVAERFAARANFSVRYVFEGTQGRSAALNTGICAARGEIIAFTDDDVLLHHEWLSGLAEVFAQCDCVAAAGRIVPLWTYPKPRWLRMEGQQAVVNFELGEERKEIRYPPMGANSAFRKEVFDRHGLFRLDLGVSGEKHTITCDDTEFGERLIRAGDKILYVPNAVVYHPVDQARITRKYFLTWYYYNGRSLTRTAGLPQEGVFWFGVPRWLFREVLTNAAAWLTCWNGVERFNRRLRTYRSVGAIVESSRLSRLTARGDTRARNGNSDVLKSKDDGVGKDVATGQRTPAA